MNRATRPTPLPEVPRNPQAGSLVIIDGFQDNVMMGQAAHGNIGAHAAQQHGFRGPVYAENIGANSVSTTPPGSRTTSNFLSERPRDPAATRQAIERYASQSQTELLSDVTGDLDKIRQRGLHDSAVNVSYGTSPQRLADDLYKRVRSAPTSPPPPAGFGSYGGFGSFGGASGFAQGEYQFSQNVLRAYGVDATKFNSPDPKVSGPERQRLQQGLLNATQRGGQTAEVQAAKTAYGQAVRNIEANNNSVVVSAGNQEQLLDGFARDAGGRRITARPDSNNNVLVNSNVTTVGATRWSGNGRERVAEYSNQSSEVDIYASGSVGTGQNQNRATDFGTSFAAPRVAAMMASLHGTRPGTPSHAVQNLMQNRLTHFLGSEQVLDFNKAEEYMRTGTF